jgi:hypothetical protein
MVDSVSFTLLYQLLATHSFWPWYATWLLPLGIAREARAHRSTIAVFTALAPALYLTGLPGALAILVVHGSTLALWLRSAMSQVNPTSSARSAWA